MLKRPKKVRLESDQDMVRVIESVIADHAPRMLERDGEDVAVLLSPEDYAALSGAPEIDPWKDYDPARVRDALVKGTGALASIDRKQLKRDLRKARQQASDGRPA
jgi:PHD/YefM family antitoxin component YafN of YafNO toxin-antitoxin module